MTLSTQTSSVTYPGTGSVGPFAFSFRVLDQVHLVVTRTVAAVPTVLVVGADYVVTGVGSRVGGAVTLLTPLAIGESLEIERIVPLTQLTSLRNQGPYFPETVEDAFDYAMMVAQQIAGSGGQLVVTVPSSGPFGSWSSTVSYVPNDVAVIGSTMYRCILAHSGHSPPNATYWVVFTTATIDELSVTDYGVVGDGVVDDTIAMQAALTAGGAQKRVVTGGNKTVKITGPLFMSGPGLVFSTVSYGNAGDGIGIHVTGAGYTALTVTGQPSTMRFTVWGDSNTANGVFFDNANFCQVQKLRVHNLDGFGAKFDRLWDSHVLDCSVERCGNATEYAWSVIGSSDTSNMSHFGRIQVEQANRKAMLVAGNTLSCVFDNIHSERATANAADVTWEFGGARCRYNTGRFHALNPAAAMIKFGGENTTYNNYAVEGATIVEIKSLNAPLTIETPNWEGTARMGLGGGGGFIRVVGGTIATWSSGIDPALGVAIEFDNVKVGAVTIGDCGNPALPERVVFRGCNIGSVSSSSALSACSLIDCIVLASLGTGVAFCLRVVRGAIATGAGVTLGGSAIVEDAWIIGNVTIKAGETLIASGRTKFDGNLTQLGNNSSLLGPEVEVTGLATGFSLAPNSGPNAHVVLPGNAWPRGARHWEPAPTAGGVPGWACTVTGAPGTWKGMAALAP